MLRKQGFLSVDGKQLEYRWITPLDPSRPSLVFLHEGLGCVELWRDFPDRVAAATGCGVLLYSRAGYGQSDPVELPRPSSYMHYEAQVVLPQILAAAELDQFILVGHSDGGSIAIIHAGSEIAVNSPALVLLAPHVFSESISRESIRRAGRLFRDTDLRTRLARYHRDVDNAFWGWHDVWLDFSFQDWNIESFIANIEVPILLIQGEDDQYGTLAQVDAIRRKAPGVTQCLVLSDCAHTPHRDQPETTLDTLVRFILTHS
jgi:pimeloyl-ACP methyl ester carboxylesterase